MRGVISNGEYCLRNLQKFCLFYYFKMENRWFDFFFRLSLGGQYFFLLKLLLIMYFFQSDDYIVYFFFKQLNNLFIFIIFQKNQ